MNHSRPIVSLDASPHSPVQHPNRPLKLFISMGMELEILRFPFRTVSPELTSSARRRKPTYSLASVPLSPTHAASSSQSCVRAPLTSPRRPETRGSWRCDLRRRCCGRCCGSSGVGDRGPCSVLVSSIGLRAGGFCTGIDMNGGSRGLSAWSVE